MANSLANQLMKNEIEALAQQVFPGKKKVYMRAAKALLNGVVTAGSMLVCKLTKTLAESKTSLKGRQELLSGWLWSHDFCTPIRDYLWQNASRSGMSSMRWPVLQVLAATGRARRLRSSQTVWAVRAL